MNKEKQVFLNAMLDERIRREVLNGGYYCYCETPCYCSHWECICFENIRDLREKAYRTFEHMHVSKSNIRKSIQRVDKDKYLYSRVWGDKYPICHL